MTKKITIGMLRAKYGSGLKTAEASSLIAYKENINFFYFSIDKVDFTNLTIEADVFENEQWIKKTVPFPDIVYNDFGKGKKKQYKKLENHVLFTAQPIGNKTYVHDLLEKDQKTTDYLIPTEAFSNIKQLHKCIEKYKKVVLKPISSNHGKGVIYVEYLSSKNSYIVNFNKNTSRISSHELEQFIHDKVTVAYLIQPFIESTTHAGLPFDIRAHLNKNRQGKWVITSLYPRIGTNDGIISNGGYIAVIYKFLKKEFGEKRYKETHKKIKKLSLDFVNHFQENYKNSFDEIGLDLALDKNENIYIFEVNVKPDHQNGFLSFQVAKNLIPYAKNLVENYKPEIIKISKNKNDNLDLFFGGLTYLGDSSKAKYNNINYNKRFTKIRKIYKDADINSINLQAPITDNSNKHKVTKHSNLNMTNTIANTFKNENFYIHLLANNHIFDYGRQCFHDTLKHLTDAQLTTLGAGTNEMKARKGAHIIKGEQKIGLLNYMSYSNCSWEKYDNFSFHNKSGIAPLIKKNVYQDISHLKRNGAKNIIVSVNWKTNNNSITDQQKKDTALLIDAGADVIIGNGGSEYQPLEIINDVPIFYCIGDFINTENDCLKQKEAFPLTISIKNNKLSHIKVWPITTGGQFHTESLKGKRAIKVLKHFFNQSNIPKDSFKISKEYAIIHFNN